MKRKRNVFQRALAAAMAALCAAALGVQTALADTPIIAQIKIGTTTGQATVSLNNNLYSGSISVPFNIDSSSPHVVVAGSVSIPDSNYILIEVTAANPNGPFTAEGKEIVVNNPNQNCNGTFTAMFSVLTASEQDVQPPEVKVTFNVNYTASTNQVTPPATETPVHNESGNNTSVPSARPLLSGKVYKNGNFEALTGMSGVGNMAELKAKKAVNQEQDQINLNADMLGKTKNGETFITLAQGLDAVQLAGKTSGSNYHFQTNQNGINVTIAPEDVIGLNEANVSVGIQDGSTAVISPRGLEGIKDGNRITIRFAQTGGTLADGQVTKTYAFESGSPNNGFVSENYFAALSIPVKSGGLVSANQWQGEVMDDDGNAKARANENVGVADEKIRLPEEEPDSPSARVASAYVTNAPMEPEALVLVREDDAGNQTIEPSGVYQDGKMVAYLSGNSKYGVVYRPTLFRDVPKGHPAYSAVTFLGARGIVTPSASGNFEPDQTVTRADYLQMLQKSFTAIRTGQIASSYLQDVPASASYAPIANWGYTNNVLGALVDDRRLFPQQSLLRQDMAFLTDNVAKCLSVAFVKRNDAPAFTDGEQIAPYAKPSVERLASAALLPAQGEVRPLDASTKAEAAILLASALSNMRVPSLKS